MDKFQRNERVGAIMKVLSDEPGKVFTLGYFAELFGAAKSTLSEDLDIIRNLLAKMDMGMIETIPGASGGVRYVPVLQEDTVNKILGALCEELSQKERILSGGYLYMLDIIYDPGKVSEIGRIFADRFYHKNVDCVITVETKGIPIAFSTAKFLHVPLVIVRHNNEATDGASVNINYVSASSRKNQTMVLSLKSLKRKSRLLFIDDFMKGGGTAKGIMELAKEFECELAGIGVLIETAIPEKKLTEDYFSLLKLYEVNEEKKEIDIRLSDKKV